MIAGTPFKDLPDWAMPLTIAILAIAALLLVATVRRLRRLSSRGAGFRGRAGRLRANRIRATRSDAGSAGAFGVMPGLGMQLAQSRIDPSTLEREHARSLFGADGQRAAAAAAPAQEFVATPDRAAGQAQRPAEGSASGAPSERPPVATDQRYETDAWIRARVRRPSGEREFLTLHVIATAVASGTRVLIVDEGGVSPSGKPIAASHVDSVVDLATSQRIDDVWNWLTSGAQPPSVILVPARRV